MQERYNVPDDIQIAHAEVVLPRTTYGMCYSHYVPTFIAGTYGMYNSRMLHSV